MKKSTILLSILSLVLSSSLFANAQTTSCSGAGVTAEYLRSNNNVTVSGTGPYTATVTANAGAGTVWGSGTTFTTDSKLATIASYLGGTGIVTLSVTGIGCRDSYTAQSANNVATVAYGSYQGMTVTCTAGCAGTGTAQVMTNLTPAIVFINNTTGNIIANGSTVPLGTLMSYGITPTTSVCSRSYVYTGTYNGETGAPPRFLPSLSGTLNTDSSIFNSEEKNTPNTKVKIFCQNGTATTSFEYTYAGTAPSPISPAVLTPSFTLVGSTNNTKTVTPTDTLTFNWSTPGATSYKFKADLPNGTLNDKEFPTTLTTWTGTMKDLLNMTSGSAALSVKACNTSNVCGGYSTPITVTVATQTVPANPSSTDDSDGEDSPSSTCLDISSPSLSYGMTDRTTNGEVSLLQDFLASQGFLRGSYSGSFGTKTRTAVMAYQARKGVAQAGRVGALTKKLIREDTCGSTIGDADDNGPYTYTNPNTPVSFTLSGATNNTKTVTPTDTLTFNWSTPGATSYKFKADLPNGTLNDKEFPTTLTTWTGTMKDLLNMTSGSAALSVSGCTTSTNCTAYSTPITVTVQASTQTNTPSVPSCTTSPKEYYYYYNPDVKNAGVDAIKHWNDFGMKEGRRACWTTLQNEGGTSSGAGTSQGGVPQVTIKAKALWGTYPTPGSYYLITWTATNNPAHCTASNGGTSDWAKSLYWTSYGALPAGVKNIPSTAGSYNQVIRLDTDNFTESYTFGISCTNAYGTSQIASVTASQTTNAQASTIRERGMDQNCTADLSSCDPKDHLHDFNVPGDVYNAKICKTELIDGVFTSSNTSGPCSTDADFVYIRNLPGVSYDAPDRRRLMGSIPHYLSRSYAGGGLAGTEGGTPRQIGYNLLKGSDGKLGLFSWVNANPGWVDNASSRNPSQVPATTLSATSPSANTVNLTWNATNDPIWCVATGGTAGWKGFKTAPVNGSSVTQTLTVSTPGTYTYELHCVNYKSPKKVDLPKVSATVTVSGQTITP